MPMIHIRIEQAKIKPNTNAETFLGLGQAIAAELALALQSVGFELTESALVLSRSSYGAEPVHDIHMTVNPGTAGLGTGSPTKVSYVKAIGRARRIPKPTSGRVNKLKVRLLVRRSQNTVINSALSIHNIPTAESSGVSFFTQGQSTIEIKRNLETKLTRSLVDMIDYLFPG